MFKRLFFVGFILVLLGACTNSSAEEGADQESENDNETTEQLIEENDKIAKEDAPQLWDQADTQLWEYVLHFSTETGHERGITNWQEWDVDLDSLMSSTNGTWETPGMLMITFMADTEIGEALGNDVWEINNRIKLVSETEAEGYIMIYGMKDDSITGRDIKIMMKEDGGTWFIESVEERQRCARGVSGEYCN